MSDPTLPRQLAGPDFRRADTLRQERADDALKGVERILKNLAGWWPPRLAKRSALDARARRIKAKAEALAPLGDAEVVRQFHEALACLKRQDKDQDDALLSVFACVGEGSRRALGMWPHPVQFHGATVLLTGRLAEMQTGEGKTLVAALAATVMGGSGAHVHVVSTNDYLAERDCHEMLPLFGFFGVPAAFVTGEMEADERQRAYRHTICYASGKEVVFDYLKDRLAGHGLLPSRVSQLRQLWGDHGTDQPPVLPALHFAIVDEADSVLIDEARTPMILSREAPGVHEPELLAWAMRQAQALEAGRHFTLDAARHDIELLPGACEALEPQPDGVRAMWRAPAWQRLLLRQALMALHLYERDQHYILAEGKVQIVDESTGRVMADRSWEQGLHQLIETKEGLALTAGRETLARMTFQRFFRRYFLLSGLTGTGAEAHRELWSVYRLKVCRIPPHRPNKRVRLPDACWPTLAAKWRHVVDDACAAAGRGQPVLIGTRSVEASEQVSAELARRGVAHTVLNARQDAEEAATVKAAGEPGRITVATNMAGRGTDIKLRDEARQAGGLHVILSEFHESARVDRQLIGRSGRQGDTGSARAIVSLEDDLFQQESGPLVRMALAHPPSSRWHRWVLGLAVAQAQRQAQRRAYRARMLTLRQDRRLSRLIGFAGKTI